MNYLRYFYKPLGIVLFFAVLGFTVKNSEPVTLHYYLGLSWSAPLVLFLLASFGLGVASTVIAGLGLIVRQRRELTALRNELTTLKSESDTVPRTDLTKIAGIS